MRKWIVACLAAALGSAPAARAQTAPIVVELFQSQGCSSCPPAIANLNALADRDGVLALDFAVTYWDYLGWKYTFASPAYTRRQYDYARGLGRAGVATPQMIVNGRQILVGADPRELARALRGARAPAAANVAFARGTVTVGAGAPAHTSADVWLVRYDPRPLRISIRAGENTGKTLAHRNIVRQLVRLGSWTGRAKTYATGPAPDPSLKTAVIVQTLSGGPILAAAKAN